MHRQSSSQTGGIKWWNSDNLCLQLVHGVLHASEVGDIGQNYKVYVFAELCGTVQDTGLSTHQQAINLMLLHRFKDNS